MHKTMNTKKQRNEENAGKSKAPRKKGKILSIKNTKIVSNITNKEKRGSQTKQKFRCSLRSSKQIREYHQFS